MNLKPKNPLSTKSDYIVISSEQAQDRHHQEAKDQNTIARLKLWLVTVSIALVVSWAVIIYMAQAGLLCQS